MNDPIITTVPLESYKQTVAKIFEFADKYASDLDEFKNDSIFKFYNFARALPYHADPKGEETVIRPKYTKLIDWKGARDCDDKTLLILAFCNLQKIPGRSVVCGQTRFKPHHIYPEVSLNGKWMSADATYYDRCMFGKNLYEEKFRKVFEK